MSVKKSDESWKDEVEKEKTRISDPPKEKAAAPEEASFALFSSTLAYQVFESLEKGEMDQAKYLIDILGILKEKTKGNLSPEEDALLEQVLYEARIKYVEKKKAAK